MPPRASKKRKHAEVPTHDELSGMQQTEQLFKSNLFRLQMTELMAEVSPPFGQANAALEAALKELRSVLTSLPTAELSWERASAPLAPPMVSHPHLACLKLKNPSVRLPFLQPAKVQLVGSYLLRTSVRPKLNIDLAVEIPAKCLNEKDFLDHRYTDKRLLYLSHLGACLARKLPELAVGDIFFATLPHAQDPSWPVLQLPFHAEAMRGDSDGEIWQVRIIPCLGKETFQPSKLRPTRCNLRGQQSADRSKQLSSSLPSPHYNNLLQLESAYGSSLETMHATLSRDASGALREAIILLKLWLRLRAVEQAGSMSGFQMGLLLIHLLEIRKLTWQMGAYHMFRVVLHFLSSTDLSKAAIVLPKSQTAEDTNDTMDDPVSPEEAAACFQGYFDFVLCDAAGSVNFGAGVSAGALAELRLHASASLAALDSTQVDDSASFSALFTQPQPPLHRYDAVICFSLGTEEASSPAAGSSLLTTKAVPLSHHDHVCTAAETVVQQGLGERAPLVRVWRPPLDDWPLSSEPALGAELFIGLHLHPQQSLSLVDRGPAPGDEEAVAAWNRLWGGKSETRRFKDGAIVHAVVWEADAGEKHNVPLQATRHLLHRHFGVSPASVRSTLVGFDAALTAPGCGVSHSPSMLIVRAFDKLGGLIRNLEGLPLSILSIQAVGASFSFTEEFPPTPTAAGAPLPLGSPSLRFVVQFESSGKWPDDLTAVAALKTAFYLKLASLLEEQAKLTCEPTRDELLVQVDGFTFCGTIFHDREAKLLEEAGRNEDAATLRERTAAATRHTSLIHTVGTEHAAFGPAVRLSKRWLSSQLFSSLVPAEMTELLVARVFTTPGIRPPGSAALGFVLFLQLLATFDFLNEPLLLASDGGLSVDARTEAQRIFASRNKDPSTPPIWIVSAAEPLGHPSCSRGPSSQELRRLRALASASLSRLSAALAASPSSSSTSATAVTSASNAPIDAIAAATAGADHRFGELAMSVFQPPLHEFDALLELTHSKIPRAHLQIPLPGRSVQGSTVKRQYANIQLGQLAEGVRPDPLQVLVEELRKQYKGLCLLFYDHNGGPYIAVKWKPAAFLPAPLKATDAQHRMLIQETMSTDKESSFTIPDVATILETMRAGSTGLVKRIQLSQHLGSSRIASALVAGSSR